ncbi:MAG: SRPBCC family protein [Actinomycetota bacterium]
MRLPSRVFEISHSRDADCSPDLLIKRILDPATWPEWQPEILSTEASGPLAQGSTVNGRARLLGFVVDGRSTTAATGDHYHEEDVIVGVRMRVHYEVEETPRGARVTRRLTAYLPGGFSGRVLSFFLKRRLRSMQVGVLESLVDQASG